MIGEMRRAVALQARARAGLADAALRRPERGKKPDSCAPGLPGPGVGLLRRPWDLGKMRQNLSLFFGSFTRPEAEGKRFVDEAPGIPGKVERNRKHRETIRHVNGTPRPWT